MAIGMFTGHAAVRNSTPPCGAKPKKRELSLFEEKEVGWNRG